MRSLWNRAAVSIALTALLACSGMGLCWRLAQRTGHECCAQTGALSAPAKACDSPVASVELTKVVPPQATAALFVATLPVIGQSSPGGAFVPAHGMKPPPLVLRI